MTVIHTSPFNRRVFSGVLQATPASNIKIRNQTKLIGVYLKLGSGRVENIAKVRNMGVAHYLAHQINYRIKHRHVVFNVNHEYTQNVKCYESLPQQLWEVIVNKSAYNELQKESLLSRKLPLGLCHHEVVSTLMLASGIGLVMGMNNQEYFLDQLITNTLNYVKTSNNPFIDGSDRHELQRQSKTTYSPH